MVILLSVYFFSLVNLINVMRFYYSYDKRIDRIICYIPVRFPYESMKSLRRDVSGFGTNLNAAKLRILKRIANVGFKYQIVLKFPLVRWKHKIITRRGIERYFRSAHYNSPIFDFKVIEPRLLRLDKMYCYDTKEKYFVVYPQTTLSSRIGKDLWLVLFILKLHKKLSE